MLNASVVLLHDNILQHMAQWSVHLQKFNLVVFNHPPCSPDLVLSAFHLFLHLKKFPSGQRQCFQNDKEVEMSVTPWFQSQAGDFYDTRIQKSVCSDANLLHYYALWVPHKADRWR